VSAPAYPSETVTVPRFGTLTFTWLDPAPEPSALDDRRHRQSPPSPVHLLNASGDVKVNGVPVRVSMYLGFRMKTGAWEHNDDPVRRRWIDYPAPRPEWDDLASYNRRPDGGSLPWQGAKYPGIVRDVVRAAALRAWQRWPEHRETARRCGIAGRLADAEHHERARAATVAEASAERERLTQQLRTFDRGRLAATTAGATAPARTTTTTEVPTMPRANAPTAAAVRTTATVRRAAAEALPAAAAADVAAPATLDRLRVRCTLREVHRKLVSYTPDGGADAPITTVYIRHEQLPDAENPPAEIVVLVDFAPSAVATAAAARQAAAPAPAAVRTAPAAPVPAKVPAKRAAPAKPAAKPAAPATAPSKRAAPAKRAAGRATGRR
jgi:hypothetical protein